MGFQQIVHTRTSYTMVTDLEGPTLHPLYSPHLTVTPPTGLSKPRPRTRPFHPAPPSPQGPPRPQMRRPPRPTPHLRCAPGLAPQAPPRPARGRAARLGVRTAHFALRRRRRRRAGGPRRFAGGRGGLRAAPGLVPEPRLRPREVGAEGRGRSRGLGRGRRGEECGPRTNGHEGWRRCAAHVRHRAQRPGTQLRGRGPAEGSLSVFPVGHPVPGAGRSVTALGTAPSARLGRRLRGRGGEDAARAPLWRPRGHPGRGALRVP